MSTTSVHLKACDVSAAESHNQRTKDLDYVRKDLKHLNEFFSYIDHSLPTEVANLKREVKEKTGRKLQKNAIPIKEGVIVIDQNTTMEDLQHFCSVCQNKFGMIPLQIYIHRDEGHSKAKKWKPNLHAHIHWRMYDTNGRNIRLSKDACAQLQTIAAECLGMQRGKSSDKKHLSSLQFKIQQKENELQQLYEQVSGKSEAVEKLKGIRDGAADLITGKSKKKIKQLEQQIDSLNTELHNSKKQSDNETRRANAATQKVKDLENYIKDNFPSEELMEHYISCQKKWEDIMGKINRCFNDICQQCGEIGLSIKESIQIFLGQQIGRESICKDGIDYFFPYKSHFTIKWDDEKKRLMFHSKYHHEWYTLTQFLSKAKTHLKETISENITSKKRGFSR